MPRTRQGRTRRVKKTKARRLGHREKVQPIRPSTTRHLTARHSVSQPVEHQQPTPISTALIEPRIAEFIRKLATGDISGAVEECTWPPTLGRGIPPVCRPFVQ